MLLNLRSTHREVAPIIGVAKSVSIRFILMHNFLAKSSHVIGLVVRTENNVMFNVVCARI